MCTAHRRLTEAINKDPTVGTAASGDKRSFAPPPPPKQPFKLSRTSSSSYPQAHMQYPVLTERYETVIRLDILNILSKLTTLKSKHASKSYVTAHFVIINGSCAFSVYQSFYRSQKVCIFISAF